MAFFFIKEALTARDQFDLCYSFSLSALTPGKRACGKLPVQKPIGIMWLFLEETILTDGSQVDAHRVCELGWSVYIAKRLRGPAMKFNVIGLAWSGILGQVWLCSLVYAVIGYLFD